MQRWRLRRVRREELQRQHGLDAARERAYLLGDTPEAHPEYLAVMARVQADLGPPPLFRVMESGATLAKLHRQGAPASAIYADAAVSGCV